MYVCWCVCEVESMTIGRLLQWIRANGKRKFTQRYCLLLLNFAGVRFSNPPRVHCDKLCNFLIHTRMTHNFELAVHWQSATIVRRHTFFVPRVFPPRVFGEGNETPYDDDDSGIEKKDDWSAVIALISSSSTALLFLCSDSFSAREWEDIQLHFFLLFRAMHFAIVEPGAARCVVFFFCIFLFSMLSRRSHIKSHQLFYVCIVHIMRGLCAQ